MNATYYEISVEYRAKPLLDTTFRDFTSVLELINRLKAADQFKDNHKGVWLILYLKPVCGGRSHMQTFRCDDRDVVIKTIYDVKNWEYEHGKV